MSDHERPAAFPADAGMNRRLSHRDPAIVIVCALFEAAWIGAGVCVVLVAAVVMGAI